MGFQDGQNQARMIDALMEILRVLKRIEKKLEDPPASSSEDGWCPR